MTLYATTAAATLSRYIANSTFLSAHQDCYSSAETI